MEEFHQKFEKQQLQKEQEKSQKNDMQNYVQLNDLPVKSQSCLQIPVPQKYSIIIRRSEPNSRSYKKLRTSNGFNVLDFIYIDQAILKGEKNGNYSYMSQYFEYKKASKISLTNDCILVKMEDKGMPKVSVKYLVQRLRSFGDQKLFEISDYVEKIANIQNVMKQASKIMQQYTIYHSQEALMNLLKPYFGKPYFGVYQTYQNSSFIARGAIISFSAARMLGYRPQQLAIKITRLGAIRDLEVFSPGSYSDILLNYFKLLSSFYDTLLEKGFSLEIWKQLTKKSIQSRTELYTRTQEKILADTELHLPDPCVVINEIVNIIYRGNQFKPIIFGKKQEVNQGAIISGNQVGLNDLENQSIVLSESQIYRNLDKQLVRGEQKSLLEIKKVAPNTLLLNEQRTCSYRALSKQQILEKRKMIKKNKLEKQKRK